MSVTGISGDTGTLSLVDLFTDQGSDSSVLDTSVTASKAERMLADKQAVSRRAQNAYGASAASGAGQAALRRALSEMKSNGGKVTFADIASYQKGLEESFSRDLRLELHKAGVPLDTEFALNMSADGKIQVSCEDQLARERIQNYLEENPQAGEQFGYIQALANLERAKQSPAANSHAWQSVQNSKAALQTQAVELFFGDALNSGMNFTALMANFGPAGDASSASRNTSFYTGIDYKI